MKELRLHGRGGQGTVIAAEILTAAFVAEGKHAAGFPMFGFERRGAPVTGFVRFNDQTIREKTQIYFPDCLIVLDPTQVKSPLIYNGLKAEGILVLNSPYPLNEPPHEDLKRTGVVDATKIALDEIGLPIPNSCMAGAFAATTGWLHLDSVLAALAQYFKGEALKNNMRGAERGFREVQVTEW